MEEKEDQEISVKESIDNLKNYFKKDSFKSYKGRFQYFKSYKVDRYIVKGAIVAIFLFLFYIAYSNNFQMDYYACGFPEGCTNPFYKEPSWKNQEHLPPGEYGFEPGPLFNNMGLVIFGILGVAGIINHLIHNRKKEVKHEKETKS